MPRYELILHGSGIGTNRFPVKADGTVIGRSAEADIVLSGGDVSRRHARIWLDGDVLAVEDLGSRNGVLVNGKRVQSAHIEPGDRLTIADTTIEVVQAQHEDNFASIIGYETASTLCERIIQGETSGRFPILYNAAQLLGSVFDLDELLRQILDLIFEALPARRGFVLTIPEGSQEPEVRAKRLLDDAAGGLPLSRTLVDKVISQREAVLTKDAVDDSRFRAAQSIVGHAIHAAMCVPLCGRESVLGAVYVDCGNSASAFSEDDLELLTALARVVGVAVENARLYQENIKRERLAALGEAMAGVGHCVKNVLTGIRGSGEFMNKAIETSDLKYLEKGWPIMRRAIDRIDTLVMNMLAFARDSRPERLPQDVNGLVDDVLHIVRTRADKLNVALEFKPGDDATANIDGRQIFRVILNLVTNAIDACERTKGTVAVATFSDARGCSIEVRDTGEGISDDIKPRLFEAFASTKGSSGIGLGLACSQKIVRAHGGTILVDSAPGQGATFTVLFPSESAS